MAYGVSAGFSHAWHRNWPGYPQQHQLGGGTSEIETPKDENDTQSMASGYWSDSAYQENFSGGGTATDPYLIENAAQLAHLAYIQNQRQNDGTHAQEHYKITADIDLSTHYWVPIGWGDNFAFDGVFDGGGYKITGLTMNVTNSNYTNYSNQPSPNLGLFGVVRNYTKNGQISYAVIRNINLVNVNINVNFVGAQRGFSLGSVVGFDSGYSRIENCHASGIITTENDYVSGGQGALVGMFVNSEMRLCGCDNFTLSGSSYTNGGLIGICFDTNLIENSYFNGTINVDKSRCGNAKTGGLIGDARGDCTIKNCYFASSTSTMKGDLNGGLIGFVWGNSLSIHSSFAAMDYSGRISKTFGSLIGSVYTGTIRLYACAYQFATSCSIIGSGSAEINETTAFINSSSLPYTESFYTSTSYMKRGSNYNEWDFSSAWYLSGNAYPRHRTQNVDITFDLNLDDTSTTRSVNYFNANNIENISSNCTNFVKANGKSQRTAISFSDSNTAGYNGVAVFLRNGIPGNDYSVVLNNSPVVGNYSGTFYLGNDAYYQHMEVRFNGSQSDGSFYYYLGDLPLDHTYTLRFRVSELNRTGNNTFTNFSITEGENTKVDSLFLENSETVIHTNSISYVPTHIPTSSWRTGYTFDGWYKKKNYLSEGVMDEFMAWINEQERSHGETNNLMQKNGNVYSWWGATAGYYGSSGFVYYDDYHTGIYLTGTYRLSYYAYCPDPEIASKTSTCLQSNNIGMDRVNSTSWQYYSGQGTFNNEEVLLGLSYNYGQKSYFKNIRLERIDADDFEGEAYVAGSSLSFGSSDKATLYAKWTEITYTLSVTLDSSSAWSEEPEIYISAYNTEGTLTKGSTWTVTVPYSGFMRYSETITLAITSDNYEKFAVGFRNKPSASDPDSYYAMADWLQRTNLYLTAYVFQKYTVTLDKGYADSGTPPDPVYKLHGDSITLPTNEMSHLGFGANGWNTSPDGTGASYADGGIYTENADLTLYPNWGPYHANVEITIVTLDKSGNVSSEIGGSVEVDYKTASNNQAVDVSETSTGGHLSFATLVGYSSWAVATANAGYVFLGFSETRSAPPHTVDEVANTGYPFPPDYSVYNLYVYFQQVSDNQLKYDRDERYWYFEDGMYPQSEVDSSLAATLDSQSFSVAEYTLYFNNGSEIPVPVYTYNGNQYARATVNGISKWFVVEPIRWRVSEYGVGEDAKPELWQNYGDTKSLVAASEKILFASIMTAEKIDDSEPTDSANFWLNDYVSTLDFTYSSGFSHSQDSFAGAGGQDVSQSGTVSTNVAVYSNTDTTLSDHTAKLTAFASFLLYGTTAYADTYDAYWTRDLETEGHSEYGCGVVVTSYGSETLRWLNQMCGVRLSYYCTEVSRF